MDIIFIEDLRLEIRVGIYPREKALPQTIEMSLEMAVSTADAGASDDIRDTVDYARVIQRLRQELGSRSFNLVEKLAEFTASLLLKEFACQSVRLSVAKIGTSPGVRRVGVRIERSL